MNKYLVILLPLLLAGCGEPKQTLNVFTFTDYIDRNLVAEFEKRFDCKVVLDFFGSGDAVMAKLASGGTGVYDIMCVGDGEVPIFSRLGFLAPLRPENIPNLKNIDPEFVRRSSDPDQRYSIPYAWMFMGIFARKPKDGPLDESWSLMFDSAKQRGSFVLFDDSRACIAAALCYRGYSINTTNLTELTEARDLLIGAKKRSLGFDIPLALRNRVLSGSARLAMAASGVDSQAPRDPETYFFLPREGSYIGLDCLAIPAKAPHRDLAEKFLNFILDAKVGAQNRVLAKGAVVGMAYNGDAARGITGDPETYYFVPKEGGQIFLDNLSVPVKAPHRDLAEKFINYILDPKVGARLSNFNQFATPNKASMEFINPGDLRNPAIYPPPDVIDRLEYLEDRGDKNKLYDELWTQIKAK